MKIVVQDLNFFSVQELPSLVRNYGRSIIGGGYIDMYSCSTQFNFKLYVSNLFDSSSAVSVFLYAYCIDIFGFTNRKINYPSSIVIIKFGPRNCRLLFVKY